MTDNKTIPDRDDAHAADIDALARNRRLEAEIQRKFERARRHADGDTADGATDTGISAQPATHWAARLAAIKAEREARWAAGEKEDARREELRCHWEENRRADIAGNGGLAVLTDDPPPDGEPHYELPRVPAPRDTRGGAVHGELLPLDEAEMQLTAIIAECRQFMRTIAFESARMTPNPQNRLGFI
jgi:hypothetical protein